MNNRLLIYISFIILSKAAFGCALGPETSLSYDSMIKISGPDLKGIYTVTVPKYIASSKHLPNLILGYTNSNEKEWSEAINAESIKLEVNKNTVTGYFSVEKIYGNKAYVYVFRPAS